ncbi:MAG: sugar ABC transporter ATP-binding protein [Thermoleophilia bacterium]|nr:sugar ABC transporter ATP-binding protein [Thermoleophilia bacterium]
MSASLRAPDLSHSPAPGSTILQINSLVKDYPGQRALDSVGLTLKEGEILALLGHNGAGKSTLVKVLAGATPATSGEILLDGVPFSPQSPAEARDAGIGVVYQNAPIIDSMSVQENLVLGFPYPRRKIRLIDWSQLGRWAADQWSRALGELEPPSLTALMRDLEPRDQWLVAIARTVLHSPRVLVLDESTVAFTGEETEQVHATLRRMAGEGTAVIYVTHRLHEALAVADRVTVLRDGRVVLTQEARTLTKDSLIRHLAGGRRELTALENGLKGEVALECCGVSCGLATNFSLTVHQGEIVGLAGLEGSGTRDVLRALFGVLPLTSGALYVHGHKAQLKAPRDALRRGLAFVPADREDQAILMHSVRHNVSLPSLRELRGRFRLLDQRSEYARIRKLAERLGVKMRHIDQSLGTLSGGNRQKAILAKWLLTQPSVLLLEEPTQAVDVGAAADIRGLLKELATENVAILLATGDLEELVDVCDRVLVMSHGRIVEELNAPLSQEEILAACHS